jgi:type I restriction enzyme S subunit
MADIKNSQNQDLQDEKVKRIAENKSSKSANAENPASDKWEIPSDWEQKKLGALVEIASGVSPSLFTLSSTGKYPYLKVEDLNNCDKYQVESREYSDDEKSIIPKNSVIFPKRGAAILNNKVRINLKAVQMDSNLMAIYPKSKNLSWEFLYYRITFEQLHKIADTSTIPQINNKHIIPYNFLLPPLPEQIAIAQLLSTWDNAITKTQALIAQKEQRKKWLMQNLLTGKMRLKGFEKTKWKKVGAGEIFESFTKKGFENEELLSATQDRGIIPRSQLEGRVTMPEGTTAGYKLVEPGDFIISLRSFQGGLEYSYFRGIVSPAYIVLKPKEKIEVEFYKQYYKSYEFIGRLATAVIGIRDGKQVSYDDFCIVKIPFPSIEEQTAIAQVLQAADKEIQLLKTKCGKLKEQKKGLMQVLLTGKKRLII